MNILNIIIITTKTLWVLIATSVTDQVNKVLLSHLIAFCRFYVSQFLTKIFCVETKSLIYFKSEFDKIIRIRLIISLTICLWTNNGSKVRDKEKTNVVKPEWFIPDPNPAPTFVEFWIQIQENVPVPNQLL